MDALMDIESPKADSLETLSGASTCRSPLAQVDPASLENEETETHEPRFT